MMIPRHPIPTCFSRAMAPAPDHPQRSLARCVVLFVGYLILTTLLVLLLEPGLTPPGFTGRGIWAMPLVLLGAFQAAKGCRAGVLFLLYGCVSTLPLLASYLGDHRLMFRFGFSPQDLRRGSSLGRLHCGHGTPYTSCRGHTLAPEERGARRSTLVRQLRA